MGKQEDLSHILDVEDRLLRGEIEIDGKVLSPEEVKQYLFSNMRQILDLGQAGFNPFDTVSIIQGEPLED